jgi:FMN reductase
MTKALIVGLGGSVREQSYSRWGLEAALKAAESLGAETQLVDLRELQLPLYIADASLSAYPQPEIIEAFLDIHRRADAFIWSSPSYNGTITNVFRNALNFIHFLSDEERPYLKGRLVGLITVNDALPIEEMRAICREMRAWASPSSVVLYKEDFAADGSLQDARALRRIERVAEELLEFTAGMKA